MTHGLQKCDVGRHDYQPRYDQCAPNRDQVAQRGGDWMVEALASKDKIYVCDICIKCGDKIARSD